MIQQGDLVKEEELESKESDAVTGVKASSRELNAPKQTRQPGAKHKAKRGRPRIDPAGQGLAAKAAGSQQGLVHPGRSSAVLSSRNPGPQPGRTGANFRISWCSSLSSA